MVELIKNLFFINSTILKTCSAICLLFVFASIAVQGKEVPAQWLTIPDFEHAPNQWFNLRKTIDLKTVPKQAIVKIAVDSKYWLWINGDLVVYEGMVKRGPNPNDTYYDELDLAVYLKKGKNTIAILAWYFGKDGFSHNDSKGFGFYFDGHIGNQRIKSDATWRIIRNQAYGDVEEGKPVNWRLPEGNVKYLASNELDGWQQRDFDDTSWEVPVELGIEGISPWNNLVKREIPQWKDYGLTKVTTLKKEGQRVIMELPYNMQFSYWFRVKAIEGQSINITTDNFEWLNDTPIRSEYITKAGVQEYEHFPWMSGHKVYFDLEEGIELLEAGYRETGYNTEIDGKFIVEDPFMTRLLQKANRTLYINMRDTFFDCPDRERAQWWGDVVLLMEESFYALDNNAHALSRKGILELVHWQKEDGVMFSPIPAGNWDKELPQQILAAIALGFKSYMLYTGDLETYKYVFPYVKRYLALWTVDEDGHVNFKSGGWNWSDWGEQIDTELLEQAWYYMALQTYADISERVGEIQEKERALRVSAKIKEFVNKNYWTEAGYQSTAYKEEIDDRGNGMMVVAGIAGEDKFETIATLLKNVRHSSPYMDKYQLEALFLMQKEEQALTRIKTRYKEMVDSELTTLWEVFEKGNWSYNHGWSGGPLSMMYKHIAGIQPTKPGFDQFQVFPTPINYKNFSCSFSTVKGEIAFDYAINKNGVKMDLLVPEGTEAIVRIPKYAKDIMFAGKGKFNLLDNNKDISFLYYSVDGGDWRIEYQQ